jgi:hypothetical protein
MRRRTKTKERISSNPHLDLLRAILFDVEQNRTISWEDWSQKPQRILIGERVLSKKEMRLFLDSWCDLYAQNELYEICSAINHIKFNHYKTKSKV